jgi:hypothetical protein
LIWVLNGCSVIFIWSGHTRQTGYDAIVIGSIESTRNTAVVVVECPVKFSGRPAVH